MMSRFKNFRQSCIAWGDRHPRIAKPATCAAFLAIILFLNYSFVLFPLSIFEIGVRASAAASQSPQTSLHVPPGVKLLWGTTAILMFGTSAVVAGFQKKVLSIFERWSVTIWAGMSGSLLASAGWVLSDIRARLDVKLEDNGLVIAYLGAWLLVLGYLMKQAWDEARDRWAERFDLPSLLVRVPPKSASPKTTQADA